MINKVFKELIRITMEVCDDDMLVKSVQRKDHLQYLDKAFDLLRPYKVKPNPEKCTFGVVFGKFLNFMSLNRAYRG